MSEVVPGLEKVQEEGAGGAAPSEGKAAPQASEQSAQERPATQPAGKQEFYWRRQAEKLEKELAAVRAEREAEVNRTARDRDEAVARAVEAEQREKRLSLISAAGLPAELAELVLEGDPQTVGACIEKLKPIAEKLARPGPRGLTNTNPPNAAGREEARLERLGAEAARGDRRALREYAHLRDKLNRTM